MALSTDCTNFDLTIISWHPGLFHFIVLDSIVYCESFPIAFGLILPCSLASMAQLALDDPASLKKLLSDCSGPAPVMANLDVLGYKSVALVGFAIPSDGQVDDLVEKLFPRALGEQIDLLLPGAASLRRVIRQCFDACQAKGGMPTEPQIAVPVKPKLSLAEYKELKLKFTDHFPGELLTPESTPSFIFVAALKDQFETGTWNWTPWRHRISEQTDFFLRKIGNRDLTSSCSKGC